MPVAGRPLVEWSLRACREATSVGPIVVAAPPGHEDGFAAEGVTVVAGGESRSKSVANALAAVESELVAVHDAARPLLTAALLDEVVALLEGDPRAGAAIAASPVTDTIKRARAEAGADGPPVVDGTLNRDGLWAVQTPQVFRADALRRGLDLVGPEGVEVATDDAMMIEWSGGRVLVHLAPADNVKVTTPTDLRLAELLLGERGPVA